MIKLLTDYGWLEVDEYSSWDVLSGSSLTEEGVEGIISTSNGLVTGHLSIRLDTVLEAVQLPAGISDLDAGLSDVDRDTLTLEERNEWLKRIANAVGNATHLNSQA